jgi:hypothetical protein
LPQPSLVDRPNGRASRDDDQATAKEAQSRRRVSSIASDAAARREIETRLQSEGAEGQAVTYAQLLARLQTLSAGDLEAQVRVLVTGQALVIQRIDGGGADVPPMLDTGVNWVEMEAACE